VAVFKRCAGWKFYSAKLNGKAMANCFIMRIKTIYRRACCFILMVRLKGFRLKAANNYSIPVKLIDEDNDTAQQVFQLKSSVKKRSDVLVTNVVSANGTVYPFQK
jgi:hypothetical protein